MSEIPKKIHYCWFGNNPLSPIAIKCIDSWKKFFPDYEIIEWNESNFDINFNLYAKEAYDLKKYAFFTDVARLYIVYKYGGIYFDTDVEVIKPFNSILDNDAFFGLEKKGIVSTGLGFGAKPNNSIIKEMLDDYNDMHFVDKNGKMNLTACPIINSKIFVKNGFKLDEKVENKNSICIYPPEYMNPKGGYGTKANITDSTVSIHHFDGSWLHKEEIKRARIMQNLTEKYGKLLATVLYNTVYMPFRILSKVKERK